MKNIKSNIGKININKLNGDGWFGFLVGEMGWWNDGGLVAV